MTNVQQKCVLIVIDGFGIAGPNSPKEGNAILNAETPWMDEFAKKDSKYAQGYTELHASSLSVGLPEGLMGNSEVGHLNIGAGRVVWQDVVRIDQTIKKGEMNKVPGITDSFQRAKDTNGRLHLLGLVSDGGVHSHINHLFSLLKVAKEIGVPEVYIHFFGDGRDTDPKSGAGYCQSLLDETKKIGIGTLATIVGRYYAMDRDKRWVRIETALNAIVGGQGEESSDPVETIKRRYEDGQTDEFLEPIILNGDKARIKDDDTLFFFNYRADRVRQITQLLGDYDRSPLPGYFFPKNLHITTMTQYKVDYKFPIAFVPQGMDNVLAEWLSKNNIKQFHVAETEKYAHVTFFFNGGIEKQFNGEERILIPSPKVATYDKDPKMSVAGVADKMCEMISSNKYPFIMSNFAPPDMVGHTGVYDAAVQACSFTDKEIGKVYQACKDAGYILFITADHGNAEEMLNEHGNPKTAHTTNKVPFIMANAPPNWSFKNENGDAVIGNVSPTILSAMGVIKPKEMLESILSK